MLSRNKFYFILKVIISFGLISYLLIKTDINNIIDSFCRIPSITLLFVFLLNILAYLVYAINWKVLLPKIPYLSLQKYTFISGYYSLILPGMMAGDISRSFILGKKNGNIEKIAGSILIQRITGMVGIFVLGLLGLIFSKYTIPLYIIILLFAGFLITSLLLFVFRLNWLFDRVNRWIKHFKKPIRIINGLSRILIEFHEYSLKFKLLLLSIIIGLIYQSLNILVIIIMSNSLGFSISIFDWLWIITLLSIALLFPITIGGLGVREGTLVGLLEIFHVPSQKSFTLSFILFGFQILFALIGGIFEWTRKETPC